MQEENNKQNFLWTGGDMKNLFRFYLSKARDKRPELFLKILSSWQGVKYFKKGQKGIKSKYVLGFFQPMH